MAATYMKDLHFTVISFGLCVLLCIASKPSNVALGRCLENDICRCRNYKEYQECWDNLHEESHEFIIPYMMHYCNIKYNSSWKFEDIAISICSIKGENAKICFDGIIQKSIEHQNEVHSSWNLSKKRVAFALEIARKCMGPLIAMCIHFVKDC